MAGVRARPVVFALESMFGGVPPRPLAEAMSATGDPEDVQFLIDKARAAKEAAEIAAKKRGN